MRTGLILLPIQGADVIVFEQFTYEVHEEVGQDDHALRVCIDIMELSAERTVTLVTSPATAQGEYYVAIMMPNQPLVTYPSTVYYIIVMVSSLKLLPVNHLFPCTSPGDMLMWCSYYG